MLTPDDLAVVSKSQSIQVPDYNFQRKMLFTNQEIIMAFTARSIQTFNHQGQPSDSQNDQND